MRVDYGDHRQASSVRANSFTKNRAKPNFHTKFRL